MKKILASILASFIVSSAFSFPVFAQEETDGDDFITPPPVEDDAEKKEDEEPEEDDDWLIIPQYEDGLEGDGN